MLKELSKTLKIAIPLIISNISQMALGLVDSAMIGPIDYRQLAASSLVLNVLAIPMVLGSGMMMAISPLVAMANGRQDINGASKILFNGFLMSLVTGCLLVIIILSTSGLLWHLGQEDIVVTYALPYYKVMACSFIPMLIFYAAKQFSDGLEITKTAMLLSLSSLPLNAFLNWIFIYGHWGAPRLELFGTGVATLITRIIIASILVTIIFRHKIYKPYLAVKNHAWKISSRTIKDLLHIGIPSSMQYGMEAAAFSVSGIMIGWLGATSQAAHQIALNMASTTFMASMGLSLAASIRVANAYGRKEVLLMNVIGKNTIVTGLIFGSLCALIFILLQHQLPYIFTNNAGVAAISSTLLVYGAFFQISDATQAIGVGLLRGMRDVKIPTILVAIAYWVIGIPLGYYLAFVNKMGATGIWIGFIAGLTMSSVLLNSRFLKQSSRLRMA
ncbi:MAG: MATE family efflux transporter [Chitinophagaceae bacterium]|nr:MATE family efflux transporter [Chitinophagaceae bacterium]